MRHRSYAVTVEEVHSGDDLIVMADLGIDRLYKKVRVRLQGVDTPNAYKAKVGSIAGNLRDEVYNLTQGNECRIEVTSEGRGGWLGILFVQRAVGEVNVNETLISRGFVYEGNGDTVNVTAAKTNTTDTPTN